MTDRPILFSGPMVRAILEGRKTQTRRTIKPQPVSQGVMEFGEAWSWKWPMVDDEGFAGATADQIARYGANSGMTKFCAGDRLWVRETYCLCKQMDDIKPSECSKYEPVGYLADGSIRQMSCAMIAQGKTRVSIHMPRWASRITLQVTDVRVERLQDICHLDAIAEGIEETKHPAVRGQRTWKDYATGRGIFTEPRDSFRTLWCSINGPDAWDANPWVAAYTFKPVFQNIDLIEPNNTGAQQCT